MEAHLMAANLDSALDVGAILAKLRESHENQSEREGTGPRLATLNFVIFVDDSAHRAWVIERATRVASKHPSRSIVLDSTGTHDGVAVSTSACSLDSATVVNEHVTVGVTELDHGGIVKLAHDLSVPGVPTFVWWSGARFLQSRTFSGLVERATGVLLDSSGKASDEETIRELADFPTRFPNVVLRDLAFMRLAPWQDMIAQFFDDPALREDLFSIRSLHIESGSAAEALYLAGWFGSRLSWEAAAGRTFFDRRRRRVPFTMEYRGGRRRILAVRLTSDDSTYVAQLSGDDRNAVCLHVEGVKAKPMFCMPLQNIDNALLVERAILTPRHDEIFETSLATVRDLIR
jgi:glucose-6-phosphate dehydrogenase assembly protein OpcA